MRQTTVTSPSRVWAATPKEEIFVQDTLVHSEILVGEPNKLQYTYEQIMAAITHRFAGGKDKPFFLVLGGGGLCPARDILKDSGPRRR